MNKPTCILQSGIFTRSGYGDWALTIAKSLLRYDKFDLKIVPTAWGSCSKKNLEPDINDPETQELLKHILNQPLTKQPEVFIQMTIPNEFQTPAKFNIGMTAFIEATVPKPEWIEGLNRMNLNIVLSKFNKDVAMAVNYSKKLPNGTSEDLKVKSPMEILFWGANTSVYYKTPIKDISLEESMKTIPESFAFLFVGQWTSGNMKADRKGIGYLIKTFLETFANVDNPPCLILKTSGAQICVMDKYDCINKINDVTNMVKSEKPNAKLPNVYLLHGELNDNEMNALFNHEKVKIHVSFTSGEGFGHPLLLATLSGKPLLVSNWSGHLDFLNPNYANLLDGKLIPMPDEAINEWFVKESQRFEVDYEKAGRVMKDYFQNYSKKILENAEKLRIENVEKFSIQSMDKVFHAMLDKYIPVFAIEETIKLPTLKRLKLPQIPAEGFRTQENLPSITVPTTITSVSNPPTQEEIKQMPTSEIKQ